MLTPSKDAVDPLPTQTAALMPGQSVRVLFVTGESMHTEEGGFDQVRAVAEFHEARIRHSCRCALGEYRHARVVVVLLLNYVVQADSRPTVRVRGEIRKIGIVSLVLSQQAYLRWNSSWLCTGGGL